MTPLGEMTQGPVRVQPSHGGQLWNVVLAAPKANVIDTPMIEALESVFLRAAAARDLKALLLEGQGEHFSYGASVREHLPETVTLMLPRFHQLVRSIIDCPVFLAGILRGQCLGGGLELAALCHRLFADPTARLGQPEIKLGVLAPVASVLLPLRVGAAAAADLCLTGRTLSATQAQAIGLVDEVSDDPRARAVAYVEEHLLPHSATSLRCAVRALRIGAAGAAAGTLARTEAVYLDALLPTHDATEGIHAFLEKRPPIWTNT